MLLSNFFFRLYFLCLCNSPFSPHCHPTPLIFRNQEYVLMEEVCLLSGLLQVCYLTLTKLMCLRLCLLLHVYVRTSVPVPSGESPGLHIHLLPIDVSSQFDFQLKDTLTL